MSTEYASEILEFLKQVQNSVESGEAQRYLVISGNDACDLDSVVCALAYAFFKQKVGHLYAST